MPSIWVRFFFLFSFFLFFKQLLNFYPSLLVVFFPFDFDYYRDFTLKTFFFNEIIIRFVFHLIEVDFLVKHLRPTAVLFARRISRWRISGVIITHIKVADKVEKTGADVFIISILSQELCDTVLTGVIVYLKLEKLGILQVVLVDRPLDNFFLKLRSPTSIINWFVVHLTTITVWNLDFRFHGAAHLIVVLKTSFDNTKV